MANRILGMRRFKPTPGGRQVIIPITQDERIQVGWAIIERLALSWSWPTRNHPPIQSAVDREVHNARRWLLAFPMPRMWHGRL